MRQDLKRFVDLFSGIGGFHLAAVEKDMECVFACDIDEDARRVYQANLGFEPQGDIKNVDANSIPDHDILFAGLPCQSFSVNGNRKGTADPRGLLYKDMINVIEAKRPKFAVMENVPGMLSINSGKWVAEIREGLNDIGYPSSMSILRLMDLGVPQNRHRVFIVANRVDAEVKWQAPVKTRAPLSSILEESPDPSWYVSDAVRERAYANHSPSHEPRLIWRERSRVWASKDYSHTLRATGSWNDQLVNGERRLTTREKLRLQGFPEWFQVEGGKLMAHRLIANAVPPPMVTAVLEQILET